MGQESGPTARRIVLGAQLRRLRETAGISRADAGYHIRGSESKISRMELGRVSFKERDVADLLTLYGVTDTDERAQFLDLIGLANEPGWWHQYADLMPSWFQDYVGLEESASHILVFEPQFVPGLLQTEAYATAIVSRGTPGSISDDDRRRVALRLRRQEVVTRARPPQLWAVIDEAVLHRPIGGTQVMRAQLEHLLELDELPNVTLRVLPYRFSGRAAEGAFSLLRFAEVDLPDLVYIEHLAGALYLDKRDEVEVYSRVVDQLAVDAESPASTRQLLTRVRSEI